MHVRYATSRDLHRLAEITTSSLKDDPAFDYMWPQWYRFHEDNFIWWQMRLQKLLYNKKTVLLVAVLDSDDDDDDTYIVDKQNCRHRPAETIVSYCIWERWGRSRAAASQWASKRTMSNIIDSINTHVQEWSLNRKYTRRDANFAHLQALTDAQEAIGREYWADHKEMWNLELIVTDREYRRRGAATLLVEWGMSRADREGVHCRVEASPMGKLLYESLGFMELAQGPWIVQAPNDDDKLPIWCMVRYPEALKASERGDYGL